MHGLQALLALALLLALSLALPRPVNGATMLVQTLPGGLSHIMAVLAIARSLHARGHSIHALMADYDLLALRERGLLDDFVQPIAFKTPPGSVQRFEALVADYQAKPQDFIGVSIQHYEEVCRQVLRDSDALAALRRLNATLTLADITWACSNPVAQVLGLPLVGVSPIELPDPFWHPIHGFPYSPAAHPFISSGMAPPLSFLDRIINTLVSKIIYAITVPVADASAHRLGREFSLPVMPTTKATHRGALLLLINTAWGLSTPRSLPPKLKMVGPLLVGKEPRPLPPALQHIIKQAGDGGIVVASFGSVFRPRSCDVARGLAAALAATNRTVVWAVNSTHFPATCPLASLGLPARVHTLAWTPQGDLLSQPGVRAFLTHAGQNSVSEAGWHGVPMVCLPQSADQLDSCAKAVKAGWALEFKSAELAPDTAHSLAATIERVSSNAAFAQKAASVRAMLRAHPQLPVEQAADWVEYALALPPGADLEDPAAALPWWRWHCLDVWAAVAAALLACLAVLALALRAAWRLARRTFPAKAAALTVDGKKES
ncbi:hypothetical protein ABPG75_006527 [Micractinium tetrahymenae]